MDSIRARFIRGEEVKYISHLDLMTVFERAIRRSGIPIAYSQGFNPHPQMVFGLPLSVGVTSEAEYGDFELTEKMNEQTFIDRMNHSLPVGLRILDAKYKKTKSNIMAAITKASYEVLVSSHERLRIDLVGRKLEEFKEHPSITVKKEGKNGIKDIDIKPMIFKLEANFLKGSELEERWNPEDNGQSSLICTNPWLMQYVNDLVNSEIKLSYKLENVFCLSILVSAGSAANLKPELLVSALNDKTDLNMKLVKIHRTGLFIGKEGETIHPLDDRVLLGL